MPRSVLALTSFGWIFSAASHQSAASWNRPASKYMLASCTRVTASVGFCCAVVFIADARDSSSGGGADALAPPADDWPGAAAAAGGAGGRPAPCWVPIIQPTSTPKKTPATPITKESLDTVNLDHSRATASCRTPADSRGRLGRGPHTGHG